MWDLPGPGLEPVSPALAGGFLTTVPPGKPLVLVLHPHLCLKLFAYRVIYPEMIYFLKQGFSVKSGKFPAFPPAVAQSSQ